MSGAVDGISIGLVAVVGLLLISLVISIIIHIYCLIKYDTLTNTVLYLRVICTDRLKSYYTVTTKETNK